MSHPRAVNVMLRGNGGQSIFFVDDDWEHFKVDGFSIVVNATPVDLDG